MSEKILDQVDKRLKKIYGNNISKAQIQKIQSLITETGNPGQLNTEKWNEKDVVLISYADSIKNNDEKPLRTLKKFMDEHLKGVLTCVHILPFFPYSSDDGFSVIDYTRVDPEMGTWNDVKNLCENFDLMADLVINHISQHSQWFKQFLNNEAPGNKYFHVVDPETDLSMVTRPRSLPLLTKYSTTTGDKYVWTTFSPDQVDLNFSNPDLMYEMLKVLLYYARQGARIIRLDAIAFLWKQIGTTCLHLPQTHEAVKLIRDIMEACYPPSVILTETNVPHTENISYFGNGDEAHMVYQFSLPPLLLHALHTGNSMYLTSWAKNIQFINESCTFFNFTASHDGIGVRPLEGILPQPEFDLLINNMKGFGGHISMKKNSDGTESPYEMNITYFDALKGTSQGEDNMQVHRFICSQTIAMSLMGVPALYIHSLTATKNYHEGVQQSGRTRTINRKKWDEQTLLHELNNPTSHTSSVFNELTRRLKIRQQFIAFHPNNPQEIIDLGSKTFVVKRSSDKYGTLLALTNITNEILSIDLSALINEPVSDLISKQVFTPQQTELEPYRTLWLNL